MYSVSGSPDSELAADPLAARPVDVADGRCRTTAKRTDSGPEPPEQHHVGWLS